MHTIRSRRAPVALTGVALVALLGASCGSDDDTTTAATGATSSSGSTSAPLVTGGAMSSVPTDDASDTGAAPSSGVYTVGMTLELTGAISELGEGFRLGAQAYVDRVNADGGVAGRQIELIALDHSNKPDQAVANATRLISDDGAIAITGMVLSSTCNAVERVASEQQIPLLCSGAEPDLLNPLRPYVFGAKMPTTFQAGAVVDFGATLLGSEDDSVAYLGLSAPSSSEYGKRVVAAAEQQGWEILAHEEVPPEVTDMSAQVAKIAAANPDLIFTGLQDAAFVLFMRTALSQGLDVPVINYESGSSMTALEGAGSANVYVGRALAYPALAGGPGVERFVDDVRAAGGDPDGSYVVNGYLAAMLVVEGLARCADSCTPGLLRDALESVQIDTGGLTSGTFGYTPDSHAPGGSINVYRWDPEAGEPALVAEDLAAATS